MIKKLINPAVSEADALKVKISYRLHIFDRASNTKFLINTGVDISLLPKPAGHRFEAQALKLFAANDTRISTYGSLRRVLHLGLWRPIKWEFVDVDVPYAIIGVGPFILL